MELHEIKEHLQNHLSDGLVVIVGSGLSCAEGLPGMNALSKQLLNKVPSSIEDEDKEQWQQVSNSLNSGVDLENTLLDIKISESLEKIIVEVTHNYIYSCEQEILDKVFSNEKILRFTKLLPHLLKPNSGIPIVTTNYDRLIEVASECAGLSVNNTFSGNYISNFDPKESKYSLCRGVSQRSKKVFLSYCDFVSVYKPHGSLDWFLVDGEPVRSDLVQGKEKLIITPGVNKFRGGYERPFDTHREQANKAIDNGNRFLIIGYGFNDEHLQVHLERQLENGKQAVVLTHSISEKFSNYIQDKENIWVICSKPVGSGFKLTIGKSNFEFDDLNIWDLEIFVSEVLE